MRAQFRQDCLHLPDKHAAIPYIMTIPQVALCRLQIRLFDKSLSPKCLVTIPLNHRVSKANVAIARFGGSRFDPQCHKIPLLGQLISKRECLLKCDNIGNGVVGMKRGHNRPWVSPRNSGRSPTNCRCGTTPHWLTEDIRDRNRGQVFMHQFGYTASRNNPGTFGCKQGCYSRQRFVYHAFATRQWQKLFRETRCTEWP